MRRTFLKTCLIAAIAFVLPFVLPAQDNKKLTPEELDQYVKQGKYYLLDVRTPEELAQFGSVKGYHHIPLQELDKRYTEIPKTAEVVTMCERGRRAETAANLLKSKGYKVVAICGLLEYREKGFESVKVGK
jgi:rhodanese-related sulfurtransferase